MLSTENNVYNTQSFIAMLAHDMKTPIRAQLRALELLTSGAFGKFSNEASFLIKNMIISNKHLEALADNILNDYKIKKGMYKINKRKNNFKNTLRLLFDQLNILTELKSQKIVITKNLPDIVFKYDEVEILRVFINLFSNALDYAKPNAEIKLDIEFLNGLFKSKIESITNCEKTVFDQGVALRAGSGLGLVICKMIIEAHGGTSDSYMTKDNRFIFEFSLPAL